MYSSIEEITNLIEPLGYKVNDPWDIVDAFEKMVAKYAGSKYAVAVDNCTNGIFLCLKYQLYCFYQFYQICPFIHVCWVYFNLKIVNEYIV